MLPEKRLRQILKDDGIICDDYRVSLVLAVTHLEQMRAALRDLVYQGHQRQNNAKHFPLQEARAKAWKEATNLAEGGLVLDTEWHNTPRMKGIRR